MHKGSPVLQPPLSFALQISNLGQEFQEVWPLASLLHTGQMSECCLPPAAAAILHRCPGGMGCLRLPPVMPALYLALCMSTSRCLCPASPGSLAPALTELCKVEERPKSIPSRSSLQLRSAFLPAVELPDVCFVWAAVPGLTPHSPRCCPGVGTSIFPVPTGTEPGRCSYDKAPPSKTDQSFCRLFSPPSTAQSLNSVKIQAESSSTFMLFFFCGKPGSLLSGVCLLP